MDYLSRLLKAEAQRVRGEVPADVQASGVPHHGDLLARSLERMASKVEQTAASGQVEEV
jgi:hypothetical protein